MNPAKTYRLSKTLYCKGQNCIKALWLFHHRERFKDKISSYRQRLFDFGHGVGKRATHYFPEGIMVQAPREQHEEALGETQAALSKNPTAIFEGAFIFNEVLVRVDILKNNFDGTWDLIEVKSSKSVKPNPHYDDVAIQKWVLVNSGIKIKNSILAHPYRGYTLNAGPDILGSFRLNKIDNEIEPNFLAIEQNINLFQDKLNGDTEPTEAIGDRCKNPYLCEFKSYCWNHLRRVPKKYI
jgi:hypothetical protein